MEGSTAGGWKDASGEEAAIEAWGSAAGMLQFRADDLDVSVQVHDRRSALSLHCSNNGRRYVRGRQ